MELLASIKNETGMYLALALIWALLGFLYAMDFLLGNLWRIKGRV